MSTKEAPLRPKRMRVGDVISHDVVTVTRRTDFKEIERRLAQHHVTAVPVVDPDGGVVGVVSESDLLLKLEARNGGGATATEESEPFKRSASTAEWLMTSPAVTVGPDEPLAAATRLMRKHRVQHLPVVSQGKLVGMLSRGDLLKVFLRSDEDIRQDVLQGVIRRILWLDPDNFEVLVNEGVVRVAGAVEQWSDVEILTDLIRSVEGVVEVRPVLTYRLDDRDLSVPPAGA